MPCLVVVGGFFGEEVKSKIVAYLANKENPVIAVRGGVGPNAGHTFCYEGKTYKVRMLPSAALNSTTQLLVGAGVLVDPDILLNEIKTFGVFDRTLIDSQCGVIEKEHIERDIAGFHLKNEIGTTGTGTGPANADRAMRVLKLAKEIPKLTRYIGDVSNTVNSGLEKKDKITSDAAKAKGWLEYGSVTGRQRRASPFDPALAKKAIRLNGATQVAITKLDIIFPNSAGVREFSKLPREAQTFIEDVEGETGLR